MKKYIFIVSILLFTICSYIMKGQDSNLVINGSFESTSHSPCGPGEYYKANGLSSANNTSVDLFSKNCSSKNFGVPNNYMGSQFSKEGNNYIGITAFYADESGVFKTKPGYQQYSESVQLELSTALLAGKAYVINFNISLAEKSAYAVSGLGVYFSPEKLEIKSNSFLEVTPHLAACEFVTEKEWQSINGTFVAKGGEKYLTIGYFNVCMDTVRVIPAFTNNSRKAYYYIDDISVTTENKPKEDVTSILYGNCFRLQELNFEPDKNTVLPESYEELKDLAHFLRTYPYLNVYIDGYTEGSDRELSEGRAMEVKKYLAAYGVKEDRLKTRGFEIVNPSTVNNELTNGHIEITVCVEDGQQ